MRWQDSLSEQAQGQLQMETVSADGDLVWSKVTGTIRQTALFEWEVFPSDGSPACLEALIPHPS